MLRSIIDIRYYPKARSLNEGRDATIAMAGSPIGGFLYSIAPWLPFLASACMYAVAGVAATGIREYGSDGGRIGDPHRIHQWRHIVDDACGIVAGRQTQR